MNILNLNHVKKEKDFMKIDTEKYNIVFTNAELNRSFNRNTDDGVKQLESLKLEFNADDIMYIKQIHSDYVIKYDEEDIKQKEGDAIITNRKNVIIGVFTADCVPVLIVDDVLGVCAAIHSGWRGTFESITLKTIEKIKREYNCNEKNIKVYIGPHIRKCCYEVSEELKEKFIEKKKNIDEADLFDGRKLNLEACILDDLKKSGIHEDNINTLNLCSYCEKDIKLHSYRKSEGSYGRMFAFIKLK